MELASGQITLSVALVLKPVLSPSNQVELLAAARGKCIWQVREIVAERFPKPDVPSSIRKLPERRPMQNPDLEEAGSSAPSRASSASLLSLAAATLVSPAPATDLPAAASPPMTFGSMPALVASPVPMPSLAAPSAFTLSSSAGEGQAASAAPRGGAAPTVSHSCIEPLSAQRYRIQFTADAGLKQKLEQARDLLRHAHPGGDFAPIVSRALDLLIDELLGRRFGAGARRKAPGPAAARPAHVPSSSPNSAHLSSAEKAPDAPAAERTPAACSCKTVTSASIAPTSRSSHIPLAARRAVLERDGLGCNWIDAHGVRCGSQAWLELDHRHPAGKGGSSEPDNLRLLCRAHNRRAAEHAYGREHIERSLRRRRERARSFRTPG